MALWRRHGLFSVYLMLVSAIAWPVIAALFEHSRHNNTGSHVVLIPLVTAALIYRGRDEIFHTVRFGWALAVPLAVLAGGLLLAHWIQGTGADGSALGIGAAALALFWIAGFALVYGSGTARRALFPVLFLAFMIPIPAPLLAAIVEILKKGSTELVALLFDATGTPYHRQGFFFALPNVAIEVADECSGIRSSIALLLTSLLAGHFFLTRTWSKVMVVAVVLPLAILKNGVRIVSLSLLSIHVDPGFLAGQLHHEGGIVFFLFTLVLLGGFLALARAVENRFRAPAPSAPGSPSYI